jgi:signal peptidase II
VLALAAIAVLAVRRRRAAEPPSRAEQVGVALVVGGALGNLVDRVVRGYVVDFIHVHGWPVFNVADIAVAVGVGFIVGARLWGRHRGRHPASP